MSIAEAYRMLYLCVMIALGLMMGLVLIRCILGPRVTDRILSINMIGTLVICCIAVLSQRLGESYLVDVALIYALISFLAVIILASVYIPGDKLRPAFDDDMKKEAKRK